MPPVVNLEQVVKRHAEKLVLDGVTLGVDDGQRVGVIGVNGSGKSTLLEIMAGTQQPDAGQVVYASGARVRYLPQEPVIDLAARAVDVVRDGLPEEVHHEADAVLDRLGIRDAGEAVAAMSGGQRKRVALAHALAQPADLLILDEPTNHLDVDVIEWLEEHLRRRLGALVLVTHDRYLLDRIATRIVEVEAGRVHTQHGSYADYLAARELREEQAAAVERRRRNRARVELEWLRRGAKARTSKARYRVEQAKTLIADEPDQQADGLAIDLPSRRLGSKVIRLRSVTKRYGERTVLRDVDLALKRGDRVGIVGPNGAGKSTLLRILAGEVEPDTGGVDVGETVHVGFYRQEADALPPQQRVIDAVQDVVLEARLSDGTRVSAGQLLERFLFPPQSQRAWIGELSGGERRRLELLRVLASVPNVLLLDEPTNDLDLDTLRVLEDYLDDWQGVVVTATHDRFFLDRVCEDVYSIAVGQGEGRVTHHPGGWWAYREARRAAPRPAAARVDRGERERPARARKLGFNERRELTQLERRIPVLEQRKAELTSALEGVGADYEAAQQTGEELSTVLTELEACESRWLELSLIAEGG